ncbi:MAG: Fe-S cluster assembly protein SufD [Chlamydiales bacterium]
MSMTAKLDPSLFLEGLKKNYRCLNTNDLLSSSRQKSWEKFENLGLPTKKDEVFRYIKMNRILNGLYSPAQKAKVHDYNQLFLPECKASTLVFVNGTFIKDISNRSDIDSSIVISPLSEAAKTYGSFLKNQWSQSLKKEKDPFAALNGALHQEGLFIFIPRRAQVKQPLSILNIIDHEKDYLLASPRIHLFAGSESSSTLLIQTHIVNGHQFGCNSFIDLSLDEAAKIEISQVETGKTQQGWHLHALRATLKRDSLLKSNFITKGGYTNRQDYRIALNGENSEVDLKGLASMNEKSEAHTNILIEHLAPHCRSNQLFKNLLGNGARASFEGEIYVDPTAQKTEAYQLNQNLLLDDSASANSKPKLQINADDVKASHGATIGQLDQEQIHYMKTRGLTEKQASILLMQGFCKDIIAELPLESLRNNILELIH